MANLVSLSRFLGGTGIAVLTIAFLLGGAEIAAQRAFADGTESTLPCLNLEDPVKPVTAKPNAVCRNKLPESPLIEYRFNACGHRTDSKCSVSGADGHDRMVLLGSSLVEGYGVPVEASFAARLPAELQRVGHHSVDVYNEAMQWGTPRSVALRMGDVLREKPIVVVWPVTPFDVQNASLRLPYIPGRQAEDRDADLAVESASPNPQRIASSQTFAGRLAASYAKHGGKGMLTAAVDKGVGLLRQTKSVFAAQHFMYLNQHEYIKHFLGNRSSADYLFVAPEMSQAGELRSFEKYYAEVSATLRSAGIPLFVTLVPSHPQVSLLSGAAGDFPEADPRALDRILADMVQRHGDNYFDILGSFENLRDPAEYFYAVDEHANERGHALLAKVIAEHLGGEPAFMKVPSKASIAASGAGL